MKVLKAIEFATKKHAGQFRKVSNEPYVTHPIKVSYLLSSFKKSKNMDDLLCAALLHDTLEDTNTTFDEISLNFGSLVATLVYELTSDSKEIEKIGKKEYLTQKMLNMSSYGLTLKLVDRLANVMDNPTDKTKVDTKDIMNAILEKRNVNKTQFNIIKSIFRYI